MREVWSRERPATGTRPSWDTTIMGHDQSRDTQHDMVLVLVAVVLAVLAARVILIVIV